VVAYAVRGEHVTRVGCPACSPLLVQEAVDADPDLGVVYVGYTTGGAS